jgi:hypothetical protein
LKVEENRQPPLFPSGELPKIEEERGHSQFQGETRMAPSGERSEENAELDFKKHKLDA